MGDEFIQKKNQSFKHQAEKIHAEEFESVSVFSRNPEEAHRLVRFRCPSGDPLPGEVVYFADVPGKDKVRVMLGTVLLGDTDAAGSAEVRAILAKHPELHGILPGKVATAKDLAGYCKAQLGVNERTD